MAIVHWEPTRDLTLLQGDVNRLFERFFGTGSTETRPNRWVPAIDISEESDEFVLRADLPGLDREDVTIEVQDRTLRIAGERRNENRTSRGGYFRFERTYGTFERMLTLPEGVDVDGISASFDRGVLELRVPKPAEIKPRRIAIDTTTGNGAETADSRSSTELTREAELVNA